MIQITCTSCKKVLSIDDAFAGAVCRCQFCGTIQTVPAKGSTQKATASAGKGSKTLFENKARSAGVGGSGLDDLADIVQSSGLSDARLRKDRSPAAPPAKNLIPLLGLAVAVILALLIVLLMVIFRGSSAPEPNSPDNVAIPSTPEIPTPNPATVTLAPSFCGMPIDQPIVVYVIDNGSSSAPFLDEVKLALFKSIESLGPDRHFQILFWNTDTDTFPTGKHTAFAVKDNIEAARRKLQDVTASGSTDPLPALQNAIGTDPGQIILITAKAGDLDVSLPDKVIALRGSSTARIDCFAINGLPTDKILSQIASKTGGKFIPLTEAQLKGFGS